ncbi:transcriptional regulator, BadM/Rrf2 family [Salinimicrobium sediminis]|uniref:Transcriptional regulator, BadM/Rrf2 family n=1 Tax=Salinimicrobium sediminis TaxID=1343891 RepID=A0A285X4J2_9FLAO|nr:Rrf2 family transcriptional regulator [Salinimicrobium sediminis]SOC79916.1 transcriptional regulator, BadM/Rrf2 family [Salinimicrobium sediminis]
MISKSCKYAIRAAVFIASKASEDVKLGVKEIAREIEAPTAFTAKLLQTLNKHKIVTSLKGPYGGFFCEKYQLNLPVLDVVNAIDGLAIFKECVMGLHQCSDVHPCPMHHRYASTRDEFLKTFSDTTLLGLANDISAGATFLTNPD